MIRAAKETRRKFTREFVSYLPEFHTSHLPPSWMMLRQGRAADIWAALKVGFHSLETGLSKRNVLYMVDCQKSVVDWEGVGAMSLFHFILFASAQDRYSPCGVGAAGCLNARDRFSTYNPSSTIESCSSRKVATSPMPWRPQIEGVN